MKIFATICSGIGAPEVAAARLGWKCLFSSEIEPFPNAVRQRHFPDAPNYGDMTQYHEWPHSNPDVLIAGTPCQAFSVAGLRKGMADPRGNLTLTFLGIIERYAPRWVLWENVPGVHSSWSDAAAAETSEATGCAATEARRIAYDLGFDTDTANSFGDFEEVDQTNDFDGFLSALEELGYGVATAIYDAQYFGLAQRRERVFVVAHIGGQWQRAAAVLFERESLCGNPPPRRETGQGIAPTISARTNGGGGLGTDADCDGAVIPIQEIGRRESQHGSGIGENGGPMFTLQNSSEHGVITLAIRGRGEESNLEIRQDGLANALLTPNGGRAGIGCGAIAHALRADGFDASEDGTGRGTPLVAEIAPTLRAGGNKTGGDRPPGTDVDTAETLIPEVCSSVTAKWSKSSGGPSGDECQNLTIAFPARLSATQRAKSQDVSPAIGAANPTAVAGSAMAVRRLTPRECERLQGFPDDYTLITIRGKPAADGPRYKALGNSMAVPVIEWLLRRMDLVDELVPLPKPSPSMPSVAKKP